ncbi:MAG: TraR/DksA C4-type zinc finger protein [Eubacteriales bacterium]
MDKESQDKFRQKLLQEKSDLENLIAAFEKGQLEISTQDSISELSMYDNHPADLGTETFERSKDFALRESSEIQLEKVQDALNHIENGTYGRCDKCGKDIPMGRLEALPSTTMCKKCKEEGEKLPDRHPRPIEEDVISPPFGGFMHDDSEFELGDAEDENEFDGEDSWQAVARYGTSETPQDISVHGINNYNQMYLDADENEGTVEQVEEIPYEKNLDGMIYQDFDGEDDETIHSRGKKGVQKNSHL